MKDEIATPTKKQIQERKLMSGRLAVKYWDMGINVDLDGDIEAVLESHGFKFTGSGIEFGSEARDLQFEKKEE